MKVLGGNVNVYDLTGGKALPSWLKGSKRKELLKKNPDLKNRKIDIIHDFDMPDISTRVMETGDGQYILVAGDYTPRIKCYDTGAHSLKFERGIDNGIVDMLAICEDFSKLVILEEDRWLELHNKGGRSSMERLPRLGTHLDYHYPDCDVFISTSGPEIDRFNLNEGRMKIPLLTKCSGGNNTLTIHPDHHKILATGSVDGTVELWDPQNPQHSSAVITIDKNDFADIGGSSKSEVTALCFNKLTLAVGTQSGQVILYDIRARKPYTVAEQSGEVIKSIKFHSSGNIMSMSSGYLKIWNPETGDTVASVTSDVILNDMCSIDNSGMFFLAADQPMVKTYFIPALGEAPKWCSKLDGLVEELQEDETIEYENYIHVSDTQLADLNLHNSSEGIIATINGYKVREDIYYKMKRITNQLIQEAFEEKKVVNKVVERNKPKLPISETPKVNAELHTAFEVLANNGSKKEYRLYQNACDGRFGELFSNPRFHNDPDDADYSLISFHKYKSGKPVKRKSDGME